MLDEVINVRTMKFSLKRRNMNQMFPVIFTEQRLIKKYINYIMNNFYEKDKSEYVSGFIGEYDDFTKNTYIKEETLKRQIRQLSPIVSSFDKEEVYVDYDNFITSIMKEGKLNNNQNKLLSNDYYSWCPPINIDMFVNYFNYYWVGKTNGYVKIYDTNETVQTLTGKKTANFGSIELENGLGIEVCQDYIGTYDKPKKYIVTGVGESIKFIDDDEFSVFYTDEEDYFVIERGSIDRNIWSLNNRWVHANVFDKMNIDVSSINAVKAKMPIIAYLKNTELYNYGSKFRIVVDYVFDLSPTEFIKLNPNDNKFGVKIKEGDKVLLIYDHTEPQNDIYQVHLVPSDENSSDSDSTEENMMITILTDQCGEDVYGKSVNGEIVMVRNGKKVYHYYNKWVLSQQKQETNQYPLFNLYDKNKILLNDQLSYYKSNFKGSHLFTYYEIKSWEKNVKYYKSEVLEYNSDFYIVKEDYISEESIVLDIDNKKITKITNFGKMVFNKFLNRYIITEFNSNNYKFNNNLNSDVIEYYDEDIKQVYNGYRYYKNILTNEFNNDWVYSEKNIEQYILTRKIADKDYTEFNFELKYNPTIKEVKVNENKVTDYEFKDNVLKLTNIKKQDIIDVLFTTDEIIDDENYVYELPMSLKSNPFNKTIDVIDFNKMFNQMDSIIQNQKDLDGVSYGRNNYYNISNDITIGSQLIQTNDSPLRLMLINDSKELGIRNIIEFVKNEYCLFKKRFKNVITKNYNNGVYEQSEINEDFSENLLDKYIVDVIEAINLGKYDLLPFYNNGVLSEFGEMYVPTTPQMIGISEAVTPELMLKNNKYYIVGHDNSIEEAFSELNHIDYRDRIILRLEEKFYNFAYEHFNNKFNLLKHIDGKFRKSKYTRKEVIDTYTQFFVKWCNDNNINAYEHKEFDSGNPFTYNYSSMISVDGEQLFGSYKAIYLYYYDTYEPHTKPYQMLGFKDKPVWWDDIYGEDYSSKNIDMWKDIENGCIKNGDNAGTYDFLKRPDLVQKYLPVDEDGKLKDPVQIGIIEDYPITFYAMKPWNIGDIGESETKWIESSEYMFDSQIINYLLRPIDWFNKAFLNDNNENDLREINLDINVHNELVDGIYIRHCGLEQWISDYLTSSKKDISTYFGNLMRNMKVLLSYKCGGYYQKDNYTIFSENYGTLPQENCHLQIYKTKNESQIRYSAIIFSKITEGFVLSGLDKAYSKFIVKKPVKNGSKFVLEENNINVAHYSDWSGYEEIPYGTIFTSIQDMYDVVIGYGKYMEEHGLIYSSMYKNEYHTYSIAGKNLLKWFETLNKESNNNGKNIILSPCVSEITIQHKGICDELGIIKNGFADVADIFGNPITSSEIDVIRLQDKTEVKVKNKNLGFIVLDFVSFEHIMLFDNETSYGDILYDDVYGKSIARLKINGIKASQWDGSLYTPGYILTNDGVYSNYDKKATDFRKVYDINDKTKEKNIDVETKKIIGYNNEKNLEQIIPNEVSSFDFYKGLIREKGSIQPIEKIKKAIDSDNTSQIKENWAFKAGEYGKTNENSVIEVYIRNERIMDNPQIVSLSTIDEEDELILEIYTNPIGSSIHYGFNETETTNVFHDKIKVKYGTTVYYDINRHGYKNKKGKIVVKKNEKVTIDLEKEEFNLTFNIEPLEAYPTIIVEYGDIMKEINYETESRSISVPYLTTVKYTIKQTYGVGGNIHNSEIDFDDIVEYVVVDQDKTLTNFLQDGYKQVIINVYDEKNNRINDVKIELNSESDATILGNTVSIKKNEHLILTITKSGYTTISNYDYGSIVESKTIDITLTRMILTYSIRVEKVSDDINIEISYDGETYTHTTTISHLMNDYVENSVKIPFGTTLFYKVSASGYDDTEGTRYITNDQTDYISLTSNEFTVQINTIPSSATVYIECDGTETKSDTITVTRGKSIKYRIVKAGYYPIEKQVYSINGDTNFNETLTMLEVGTRINDVATIIGTYNGMIVSVLDAKYRKNKVKWSLSEGYTGLPLYDYYGDGPDTFPEYRRLALMANETAEYNMNYIINNNDLNNFPAFFEAHNSCSIEIYGEIFNSLLPTTAESKMILLNAFMIDSKDPTVDSYRQYSIDSMCNNDSNYAFWTSIEEGRTLAWSAYSKWKESDPDSSYLYIIASGKTSTSNIVPVFEFPIE